MYPRLHPECPRCHQAVSTEHIACRSCGAPHHPECWVHGRGCGFYACGGNPGVVPPPLQPAGRAVLRAVPGRRGREPIDGSLLVGLAASAALVVFGLVAWLGRDLHPPEEARLERGPALMTAAVVSPPASLFVHDVAVEQALTTATVSWCGPKGHAPTFRFGREAADRELPVVPWDGSWRVALPPLEPGTAYSYRIGGLPGGALLADRMTALPPSEPGAVRVRTQLLDLPDGMALEAASFGPARFARPLWVRESESAAAVTVAGARVIAHDARHVTALGATDGAVLWTHPAPCEGRVPAPVVAAGCVVVATPEGPRALEVETGRPRWKLPLAGMRGMWAVGDEVYVELPGPPARLYRIEADGGRIVAILPMPEVPHELEVAGSIVLERMDEQGAVLMRGVDRLRGERRWERLCCGAEVPLLAPRACGERLVLGYRDRVEVRSLATGALVGTHALTAAPTALVPDADGRLLVGTGGDEPRVELLNPDLSPKRSWSLSGAPVAGTILGERAALATSSGIALVELSAGPHWGITGVVPQVAPLLTSEGHLVAPLPPLAGSAYHDRLVVLGLGR